MTLAIALADRGWSNYQIASRLGVHERTVRRHFEAAGYKRHLIPVERQPDRFAFDLDKPILHEGDLMVTADWHVPLYDPHYVNEMILKARELGIGDLLIAGDFWNFDALSSYDPKQDTAGLEREWAEGTAVMRVLLETFDRIYYLWGNHDVRLTRALGFKMRFAESMKLVFGSLGEEAMERMVFTNLDHMWVENGGERFYVCHPANYAQTPLTNARKLAAKYQAHVVTAHSHHFAAGSDVSGKFMVAEAGGLFDHNKTAYLQRSTTFPTWCQGYGWIKDGRMNLTSPLWGINESA